MEFSTFFEHAMQNVDLFFLLLGAVLVLAMHAGFAFLELGTVRHKNQVNALSKILTDFALSAIAYFLLAITFRMVSTSFMMERFYQVIMATILCVASFYLLLLRQSLPLFRVVLLNARKCVHKQLQHSLWWRWFIHF